MEHVRPHTVCERLILNDRWLFDVEQDQLIDLEGRVASVTLQPVAVRVLVLLSNAPQSVLRRRQLFDLGWRSFGFEICENSLNQVIHSLRATFEVLDPGRPYIKTVPRIGYCLLAQVYERTCRTTPRRRRGCCLPRVPNPACPRKPTS